MPERFAIGVRAGCQTEIVTEVPQSGSHRSRRSCSGRPRWPVLGATAAGLVAAAGAALLTIGPVDPVGATPDPTLPNSPRAGAPPSEIVLSGLGPGQGVTGFIGPAGSVSSPGVPYPPSTAPGTGFTPLNEGFAGVILANPGSLQMYCINILTPTNIGYGYNLGTWDEANVSNVGFVARLLNDYYPNTAQPPIGVNGVVDTADQAAAVQAAIWYFSDNYVLASSDPLLAAVTTIVNTVRVQSPLPAPTPPSLQITPPASTTGDADTLVGPYVVVTDDPAGATVSATGASMFADASGTTPMANGTTVVSGTQIWLTAPAAGSATLTAVAEADVPSGNAYLYSGNISGVNDAQNLILAQSVRVTANASAPAEFTTPTTTTSTTTTTTTTTTPTTTDSTTTTSSTTSSTSSTSSTSVTPTTPTTSPSVAPSVIVTIPQTGSGSTQRGLRRRPAPGRGRLLRLRDRPACPHDA